jgi:4-hydroxy-3-methylbut-2-enyl diphosphate reductase
MKQFEIPAFYKSPIISKVKDLRKALDPRKRDFTPTLLDFGTLQIYVARHFGFCYGVENAIEISYKALEENKGKRIFLLSQMIHNPDVNKDLTSHGIQFLQDTEGKQLIPFEELTSDDIVIIPAFGATIEIMKKLENIGVDVQKYNTTCPFVEKVWNRSEKLGQEQHTIIIHGKHTHEETRATFSHSSQSAPSLIIKDIHETQALAEIILGNRPAADFYSIFKGRMTDGFDVSKDLLKVGVVNQTTMLATETQEIADFMRTTMIKKYGLDSIKDHFADTRDTLCYATNDNQNSTLGLLTIDADMAIVVGGYNSSNTTHLVELLEQKFKTYFIQNADEIKNSTEIHHFDIHEHTEVTTTDFLPQTARPTFIITSGASCPDAMVDKVIHELLSFYKDHKNFSEVIKETETRYL